MFGSIALRASGFDFGFVLRSLLKKARKRSVCQQRLSLASLNAILSISGNYTLRKTEEPHIKSFGVFFTDHSPGSVTSGGLFQGHFTTGQSHPAR